MLFSGCEKISIGFSKTFKNSLSDVSGEAALANHVVMQVISQKVSTPVAAMPVIDCEEMAFGPGGRRVVFWLHDIQDYGNSVFIVIPNSTLVGIGGVALDMPVRSN